MLLNQDEKDVPFLEWAAQKICETDVESMISTVVVLPSRRACTVLMQYLMESYPERAFLMPEVISINEFWTRLSGFAVPDNDILLLELYEIYQKHWPDEISFEEFLPWGRMMLSDFDEIDKYNVDAKKLFTIIQDIKEIDEHFKIDEELKEIMRHFWKVVHADKPYEQSFIKTWEVVGKIYQEYALALKNKMLAYEGLAFRTYYHEIKNAESVVFPYSHIHFAGFNAFADLDVLLIKKLADLSDVAMYWDADDYFMDNNYHEAGDFLRVYKTLFPGIKSFWKDGSVLSTRKKYHLHGAPLHQGQVKVAADILKKYIALNDGKRTGVVLCEENILESFLYELKDLDMTNITMSFPVGESSVTDWLEILYRINSSETIHKSELNRLFKHSYFRILVDDANVRQFKKRFLDSSVFFFSKKNLSGHIDLLLSGEGERFASLRELCRFWIRSLEKLKENIQGQNQQLGIIIPYFIQAIYDKQVILEPFESKVSFKAIYQLLLSHIKSIAVPFLSDQKMPVQVMGFLESRLMDFDRVIIVGANEEILPRSRRGNSYIPYNLRKPFGLPTLKAFDGIYAYHFYRLLKRSEESHLIYNNVPGEQPFERSRFLGQIMLELNTPENIITRTSWSYPLKDHTKEKSSEESTGRIIIKKTPEHIEILRNRSYSQSALVLYLRCPVQFYLKYVAEIEEPRETEEIMDAGSFGNVLHKTIEILYQDFLQQQVTADKIRAKLPLLEITLKEAFETEYQSFNQLKGQNLLAYDIILQSLKKIIETDIRMAEEEPFEILLLEGERQRSVTLKDRQEISFQGKIDRVDKISSGVRILDYKTGKVELAGDLRDLSKVFERFNHTTKPQTFQGLFYQFLLNESSAIIGFYSIRDLSKGIQYLNDGLQIPAETQSMFIEQLTNLLEEILNPDIPFVQNANPDAYKFSPYQFVMN